MRPVLVRWASVADLEPVGMGLSEGERARFEAFRQLPDRQRFVGVRRLLRAVVGTHAGCAEEDVEILQTCSRCGRPHGRPTVLVRGGRGPEVSMAHAGALVVVAVAGTSVGVDLEPASATDDLRTWVRREAVLKATGYGLEVDPSLLTLSAPEQPPALRAWNGPGRRPRLQLADVAMTGYVGAVARVGRRPLHLDAAAVRLSPS